MNAVVLPPELEQFAAEAVNSGRFENIDQVVRAGMELLRQKEQARTELLASVLAAKTEGDQVGYLTADEVAAHIRTTIARKIGKSG